jgi:hypothetical protein
MASRRGRPSTFSGSTAQPRHNRRRRAICLPVRGTLPTYRFGSYQITECQSVRNRGFPEFVAIQYARFQGADPTSLELTTVAEQLIQNQLLDKDGWKFIRPIKRMDLGGRSAPLTSSTKKLNQFIYDILRSLFLQKVTAIKSLSRHRCGRFLPPSAATPTRLERDFAGVRRCFLKR